MANTSRKTKRIGQCGYCSRLIAAARVIQEEAGKWRAPVSQYANQPTFLYEFRDLFLEGQTDADTT